MRVAIAETSWTTLALANALERARFLVTRVNDGTDLLDHADLGEPDAILFDMDLPDMRAREALRRIRHRCPRIAILVIGRDQPEQDAALLFDGADHVLARDCDPAEAIARLRSATLRWHGHLRSRIALHSGLLQVDCAARVAWIGGHTLRFTPTEFELLEMLSLRRGAVVSRQSMLDHLHAFSVDAGTKLIDVYICKIRARIAQAGGDPDIVKTIHGRGYMISDEQRVAPAVALPLAA